MCNITIKTTKEFFFGGAKKGIIKMCITEKLDKPEDEKYYLKIVDSCVKEREELRPKVDETGAVIGTETIIEEDVLGSIERYLTFTYAELNAIAKALNLNIKYFENITDFINELFRQGFLFVTVNECKAGILGEKGKGRYQTTAPDWVIVR